MLAIIWVENYTEITQTVCVVLKTRQIVLFLIHLFLEWACISKQWIEQLQGEC